MIPALVINLDRSPDRLAHITRQFEVAELTFERLRAVDGLALPPSVEKYFPPGCRLTPGEVGCYASHLLAWQRIAAGEFGPAALVCEDDVHLPTNARALLPEIVAKAPPGWGIIRLSSPTKRAVATLAQLQGGGHLVCYSRQPLGSAATLVTREAARALLGPCPRYRPADQDLRRPWLFGIKAYGVYPCPFKQPDTDTIAGASGPRAGRVLEATDGLRRGWYSLQALGPNQWLRCAAWNAIGRKLERPRPSRAVPVTP